MWWDDQNLNAARVDAAGRKWFFWVWHEVVDRTHVVQVFFWDEARESTGVMVLPEGARTDVAALHAVIQKLTSDSELRRRCLRELKFPLDRYYSAVGVTPDEIGH